MKQFIYPHKIIEAINVKDADNLFIEKELQIGVTEKIMTKFSNKSYIILDFGLEMRGGIRILTAIAKNTKIRIRFGESLTESCSELSSPKNATNDHSLRDFVINLQNYSDMTFGCTGFRFVRIDFYGKVEVKSIIAENYILNKKSKYQYTGNDLDLKRIFKVAKRTIDLCSAGQYVWDGIKRDRLVWIGDMHPEMLALTSLYGRMSIIERSLEFVKNQTPLPEWMNWYPMYSMWWIIIVVDYLNITNAEDFAVKQLDYISGLIDLMLQYVDEKGETNYPLNFVDWPTHETEDEIHGVRAINIIAVKKAIKVLSRFGKKIANAKELLLRLTLKSIDVVKSKSVLGLKYFAVGINEEDKKKLIDNGAEGMTTFMSYYILKAVASFDIQKSKEMLKEYYLGMINKGATTFWEDFDVSWVKSSCRIDEFPTESQKDIHGDFGAFCYKGFRHSLCHGWSAGIIKFIQEYC